MDARTWTLVLNTLLLAGATCAISVPLGTALALVLSRTDLPGRRAGVVLLGLMLLVPLYLQAAAWQAGFGMQGWLMLATGTPPWIDGWCGAVWVHAMAAVPWVALIVGIGLSLVEPELEERALLDGYPLQVFFHVTLPAALPAIGVATLWVGITAAREMTVTDLFGVRTYAEEVYTEFALGGDPSRAPLALLPGILVTAALLAFAMLLCARLAPHDRPIGVRRRHIFQLRRGRRVIAAMTAAAFALLAAVPLGNLCYKAGVLVTQTDVGRQRSWSIAKCLDIVVASPWRFRREAGWSLGIAALAATAAVVVSLGLAWIARRGGRRAWPAIATTALCLAVPGPLVGVAIIRLLNRPDCAMLTWLYDRSILAPMLAMFVAGLPLATLILWHAMRTVPPEMLDAAAIDGAGGWTQLWRIAMPYRLGAIALAWIVAMTVAMGDLAASILVVPPGVTTLSIRIFGLLHAGVEDRVAGICLAMLLGWAVIAAVAMRLAAGWQGMR